MLVAPQLDDRHFQDIVDEAKKRIPHYCEEWTDHNVSDPGVTMIELFAWMTDMLLYRLNQVPVRHYVKFMEMLGMKLAPPVPAKAPVTFWLTAPQEVALTIPAGTEVASTQTETERSIVFTTDRPFEIVLPKLGGVVTETAVGGGNQRKTLTAQNLRRLTVGSPEGVRVFAAQPQTDDAVYFGFENNLSNHILGLDLRFKTAEGGGVNPNMPPYVWEASAGEGERWQRCDVEMDGTRSMNGNGRVRLHLPVLGKTAVSGESRYWVRARLREISAAERREGMTPYKASPQLQQVAVASWGGTTTATHAQVIRREFLGQSDGTPGQKFYLAAAPVLARRQDEVLMVQAEGEAAVAWEEVESFSESGPHDLHYTLDSTSGEVRLGAAVRQPDGTMKLFGKIPPRSANLVFEQYRYGGGQEGNVQAGILNTLKTAIPYILRVSNRAPGWGGMDAETLEAAMMRAPSLLRTRERAVSETDFEFLARQALPAAIGRVKCLQPRLVQGGRVQPGQVYVLVVPRVPHAAGFLEPSMLEPSGRDLAKLTGYLDERRLLTTRLDVGAPAYKWVAARVQVRPVPGADAEAVEDEILSRLYRFLNPLVGGTDGAGWPFGRDLFVSDVYQCLQGMGLVQFVRNVEIFAAAPGGGPQGEALEQVEVVGHGVVVSGLHVVEFV